jgi:cyd operon protein YbgT
MWYLAWALGVCLAVTVGIINVMWLEADYFDPLEKEKRE